MKTDWAKLSLLITAAVILLMLVFPPFVIHAGGGKIGNAGYHFIIDPSVGYAVIDSQALIVQCLIVALVGVLAHFGLK
jgi:hypothetical protein